MKKETKVLIYSMINNIVIAVAKVICGFVYGMTSLFSDGLHTFCDFITDIICIVGAKIAKKRPTKYHPFGFGKIEYLTNLFIGVVTFLLGVYIIINSFGKDVYTPPMDVFWFVCATFLLKYIAIYVMHEVGEDVNSELLIASVEESKADLFSTALVAIITILLQYENQYPILEYSDMIGSIIIGLFVLKTSYKILVSNSLSLIGEVETDQKEIVKVDKFLSKYKSILNKEIELIKYGAYYRLQLVLVLDNKLSLQQVINLENKIKKEITRHYSLKIKHVTIYVTNKI